MKMVRLASVGDVESLSASMQSSTARARLRKKAFALASTNRREVVIVADGNGGRLAGFVVQLKKSFCYDEYMPEITEVYVRPVSRAGSRAGNADLRAGILQKNIPAPQLRAVDGQR